jgi:hypothetical protein
VRHHPIPVLGAQRHHLELHPQPGTHRAAHRDILLPGTRVPGVAEILLKPNLEVESGDGVAGGVEEVEGEGGVDAAAQEEGDLEWGTARVTPATMDFEYAGQTTVDASTESQ